MSSEDIRCINGPDVVWYVNVVLGVIAFISNVSLLAVILKEKPIKRTQKLVAAYAVGCAISGAGFSAAFIRRILLNCKHTMFTPIECMYKTPHLTLYAVGEALTALCVFFMSIDRLMAIIYSNRMQQWNKYLTNRLLIISIILTMVDILWAWFSALNNSQSLIPAYCYRFKVVSREYYLTHFIWTALIGYVTLVLYCIALATLKRMRSTSRGIRSIQLKREALISKRITIIVFFTFLLQSIPTTIRLYALFNRNIFFVPDQLWTVHCVNLSIYAVYCIGTSLECKLWLSKLKHATWFSKQTFVSSVSYHRKKVSLNKEPVTKMRC